MTTTERFNELIKTPSFKIVVDAWAWSKENRKKAILFWFFEVYANAYAIVHIDETLAWMQSALRFIIGGVLGLK